VLRQKWSRGQVEARLANTPPCLIGMEACVGAHHLGFDLARLAGDGRIATGNVRAVPVGKYAKAALEKLGSWAAAAPKFAMTENVRATLTLVARGEAPLGIVYATDAKVEPRVKIIGTFPDDSHPAIVYPAAATSRPGSCCCWPGFCCPPPPCCPR
jgi:molybdenum ABC transporter molybdate-binding protein